MRLEADDGRPEASPPLRGVVQAADRAALRERQAGGAARVGAVAGDAPVRQADEQAHVRPLAADNRTPERNEPVELRKRNGQLEMEVDVSEQAAPVFARR